MIREQIRKDVDEEILQALRTSEIPRVSPKELKKEILSRGISRAAYFRHKKKLLQQRKIEELKLLGTDGRHHKWLQSIYPKQIATQQDIELYLDQMSSSVSVIQERGYEFFQRLCSNKRTAWYFSPRFSPLFRDKKEVKRFLKTKLDTSYNNQLQFLDAIDHMLALEPEGSLWKDNLIDCSQKLIEGLVWEYPTIHIGTRAFQILRKFPGKPLHDVAIKLLVELNDPAFKHFFSDIVYTLLESPSAEERKYYIRRKLDELSVQSGILRARVEKILRRAKP